MIKTYAFCTFSISNRREEEKNSVEQNEHDDDQCCSHFSSFSISESMAICRAQLLVCFLVLRCTVAGREKQLEIQEFIFCFVCS